MRNVCQRTLERQKPETLLLLQSDEMPVGRRQSGGVRCPPVWAWLDATARLLALGQRVVWDGLKMMYAVHTTWGLDTDADDSDDDGDNNDDDASVIRWFYFT